MLDRITRLLEKGGTMLATHHECGAPLFRYRGAVVCPVCSLSDGSEIESVKPKRSGEEQEPPTVPAMHNGLNPILPFSEKSERSKNIIPASSDVAPRHELSGQSTPLEKDTMTDLRSALLSRIKKLTEAVEEEQDLYRLKVQLDCLESAIKALRAVNDM